MENWGFVNSFQKVFIYSQDVRPDTDGQRMAIRFWTCNNPNSPWLLKFHSVSQPLWAQLLAEILIHAVLVFHCCDQITDRNKLMEETFVLAHGL